MLGEDQFQKPWMVSIANDHYEVDCSRAQEIIGWSPSHRLSKVLPAIIQNLNNDPYSWYRVNGLNPARVAHDKTLTADMDEDNAPKDPVQARAEEREHTKSMEKMHFNNLWVHFATMMLGLWLASAPLVLGTFTTNEFSDLVQQVTIDRGLWEPELRNRLTAWNDVIVGALMMIFSCFSLTRRGGLAQWSNACLGVWLLFAPILFWTPSAAVYLNHTLVGALAIAFTILIPMMPGMSQESMMDPSEVPPGWSYSPSSYLQRVPMIALGLIGFVLARILAAYQLGHVDWVWEPFFIGNIERNGSELIITSEISKAWPIADGGLGAITYMFEVLMGIMGGRARWRTMPWMVVLFGIAVVPLGVISIYFIIIQPIMIGTYCTLCLITALGMLIMIPFALDELVAMGQFLLLNTRSGQPFWRAFFRGGALPGGTKDKRAGFSDSIGQSYLSAVRGVNVPWTLAASTVLGLWLMFSRLAFGTEGDLANSDHLVGALVITTAIISMAEVARPARLFNLLLGVWLVVAPWVLSGGQIDGQLSTTLCGTLLLALSLPRGHRSSEHYGEWDRYIV
ncbi:vitamin K epoxide reductase family protein [Paraglaciecola chathamensis]|nr:vitamin K epoxide reductase family protein [Paraglaciecola oceanifecundans]